MVITSAILVIAIICDIISCIVLFFNMNDTSENSPTRFTIATLLVIGMLMTTLL